MSRAEVRTSASLLAVLRGMPISARRASLGLASVALAALMLTGTLRAASAVERYDRLGISFEYPGSWFVTTEPLSAARDPYYRFAASTVPVRRTRRDIGPCLPGIARQLPLNAALVFLKENTGASRRRALPRLDPMPRRFSLSPGSVPCGFHLRGAPHIPYGGGDSIDFREARRALILRVWVGPSATKATKRQLRRIVASLEISPR